MAPVEKNFNWLVTSLRNEKESEFLEGLHTIVQSDPSQLYELFQANDDKNSLLTLACEKGFKTAVEVMIRFGADINAAIDTIQGPLTPIESACHYGNWEVLELLLESPKLDLCRSTPLLSIVVKNIGKIRSEKCNYHKCFELLLNYKHIAIDQLDAYGRSPLFYAVKFNNKDAILELLKRGAYIGQMNISREVLEKHFDNCINMNNLFTNDDEYEIQFDYSNLVPVKIRSENTKEIDYECSKTIDGVNEMTAIDFITEAKELRQLMQHPLIMSFVLLKWNQYADMFLVNFILSVLFTLSNTVFILLIFIGSKDFAEKETTLKLLFKSTSLLLTFYIILREMSQLVLSPWTYFQNVVNYVEWAMIVNVLIVLLNFKELAHSVFACTSLILIGIELVHLTGSLPFGSFSTHCVMLKKLISTFLKKVFHYAIPFVVFLSAYVVLLCCISNLESQKDIIAVKKIGNVSDRVDGILKQVEHIVTIIDAIVKNRELFIISLSCLFVFLFTIPTVFLNLLNGLVVNDIQTMESQAELTNLINRCQVLTRYERILLENDNWCCFAVLKKFFSRDAVCVFRKIAPTYRIGVRTNANNQITFATESDDRLPMLCSSFQTCFDRYSKMSDEIVDSANVVLRKVNSVSTTLEEEIELIKKQLAILLSMSRKPKQ